MCRLCLPATQSLLASSLNILTHYRISVGMPHVFEAYKRLATRLMPRVLLAMKLNKLATGAKNTPSFAPAASLAKIEQHLAFSSQRTSPPHNAQGDVQCSTSRSTVGGMTKDVLLLGLEALAQSADVFPPLKSAVGGLLFFTAQIGVSCTTRIQSPSLSDIHLQLVSGNKELVNDIYAQIDSFADSLARAIPDATVLSPAHEAAIRALAEYAGPRILSASKLIFGCVVISRLCV